MQRIVKTCLSCLGAVLGIVVAPIASAHGGGDVSWSVTVGSAYPAPRVYSPPPVVYAPPPTVYVRPQPVFVQPAPIVTYGQPYYVEERHHGWHHHNRHHHQQWRQPYYGR